jgi:hypothetical protein
MTQIILASDGTNPFEQIRLLDADGSEYWLATEFLALLGYQAWKRIKDVVERAKISTKNFGLDESWHLVDVVQMPKIEAFQAFPEVLKDYKLSRHACYNLNYVAISPKLLLTKFLVDLPILLKLMTIKPLTIWLGFLVYLTR